ncbi:MAG: hypothetical protein ACR2QA_19250 [Solirubrobacteraceae bacterium]
MTPQQIAQARVEGRLSERGAQTYIAGQLAHGQVELATAEALNGQGSDTEAREAIERATAASNGAAMVTTAIARAREDGVVEDAGMDWSDYVAHEITRAAQAAVPEPTHEDYDRSAALLRTQSLAIRDRVLEQRALLDQNAPSSLTPGMERAHELADAYLAAAREWERLADVLYEQTRGT